MPPSPSRDRSGSRLIAAAIAVVLAVPVGCETSRTATTPTPPAPPQPEIRPRGAEPSSQTPVAVAPPPGHYATRKGHYVFYHDFELDPADPLFPELEALPDQVFGELDLPPTTRIIQVFLFDTQERYDRYMRVKYPILPPRRAYFVAEPHVGGDELKVFTWMGDHLRTDLRHELTHALLHGVLKDVPIWLDEGLAGYFELPPEQNGVNQQHLELLRRGPFQPDLGRLEQLTKVKQMEKPEYREAWAWAHLMLRGSPEAKLILQSYLQILRTTDKPGALLPRLKEVIPDPDLALSEHLNRIEMPRSRR